MAVRTVVRSDLKNATMPSWRSIVIAQSATPLYGLCATCRFRKQMCRTCRAAGPTYTSQAEPVQAAQSTTIVDETPAAAASQYRRGR